MKTLATTIAVVFSLATTSLAQVQRPGSLLMFPLIHNSGLFLEIVSVTNTNKFSSTLAHYRYYSATPTGIPFQSDCQQLDEVEFLTAADTKSVAVACHSPHGPGTGDGYLVVTAADPFFSPPLVVDWAFNHLVGSVMSIDGATGLVYTYDPIAFDSFLGEGTPTDQDFDSEIDFDGFEYDLISDTLTFDSIFALINPELCLVNVTGAVSDINCVLFSIWNDNEFPLGHQIEMSCWMNERVTAISLMFTEALLLATPHDPSELDITCDGVGDFETAWCCIQSIAVYDEFGTMVSDDGPLMGVVTSAPGARHLWGSRGKIAK